MPHFTRVFILTEGSCSIAADGKEHSLCPGSIYLLPSNFNFVATHTAGSVLYYFHIILETGIGLNLFDNVNDMQVLGNQQALIQEICDNYEPSSLDAHMMWQPALFRALCIFAGPYLHSLLEKSRRAIKYRKLIGYIQSNLKAGLSVDALSREFNISRSSLSRGFQHALGIPLKEFIVQLVLQRAKELLETTNLTVKEIAYDLGYNDPYYFQKVFKKFVTHTPIQHRNAVRLQSFPTKYPLWESQLEPTRSEESSEAIIK